MMKKKFRILTYSNEHALSALAALFAVLSFALLTITSAFRLAETIVVLLFVLFCVIVWKSEAQKKFSARFIDTGPKFESDPHGKIQNLEIFKLAVDNASDHIVITDPEGIILYANKAALKSTGFSQDELIGHKAGTKENWGGLMEKKDYENMWYFIKVYKNTWIGGIKNKRKNGDYYVVYASISPILDKEKNVLYFVSIEHDVTKEKEIDRAKTEFVSLASHQLRTPLSSINWYAEMLLAGTLARLTPSKRNTSKKFTRETSGWLTW